MRRLLRFCVPVTVRLAAVFLLAGMCLPVPVTAATDVLRPNVVLIVLDDMGYSDLGAYGGEIRTPNIDALATAGVKFSQFHVASSCGPTRAMLMTGVDHHRAGIGSMPELMPLSHRGKPGYLGVLNERVRTLGTYLQAAGYYTAVAGKWHLGVETHNLPPARGFNYSFIQADSGSDNFEMRPYLPMQAAARWYEGGARLDALPEDFYSSRYFVDRLIDNLAAPIRDRQPFFAYLAFQANHTPLQAPAEFIDAYRGQYLEGWAAVRQQRIDRLRELGMLAPGVALAPGPDADWQALSVDEQYFEARRMQAYAGMATAMDHEVGRLLDFLRQRAVYDNTVFIVLSDNGAAASEPYENASARRWLEKHYHRNVETLGTRGSWVSAGRHWGRVSNTPLHGLKFSASEGGLRAPLIVAGPVPGQGGRVIADRVHVTDLLPTILALANVPPMAPDETFVQPAGDNLLPLLAGVALPGDAAGRVTGFEFSGNSALYRGSMKITRNRPPAGDGQWRLFDLAADPGETRDLRESQPETFNAMLSHYHQYEQTMGVLPMPDNYSLNRQVAINALLFSFLPRYRTVIVGVGLVLVAAVILLWRKRRARSIAREAAHD